MLAALDLPSKLALDPRQFLGIPIALLGAILLSVGAQLQHRGVATIERRTGKAPSGLGIRQLALLLSRPSWVGGQLLIFAAIALQLTALGFAPLIVVQPLGAVALVVTGILNARVSHQRLNRQTVTSIVMCVAGVMLFVIVAAFTAREVPIGDGQMVTILVILLVVLVAAVASFLRFRRHGKPLFYVIAAGFLYGFVATLAKVVINRLIEGNATPLILLAGAGLIVALLLGAYFVQNAYSSGPPDLVIAGLTVIDPLVAVTIGVVVLREAVAAPAWAVVAFLVFAVIAIVGVFRLARHHPELA